MLIVFAFIVHIITVLGQGSDDAWFQHMIKPDYGKEWSPSLYEHNILQNANFSPTQVFCVLDPTFVTDVSLRTMDFQVELNVNVTWSDNRLVDPTDLLGRGAGSTITLIPKVATLLWYPQLFFENCKGCVDDFMDPKVNQMSMKWKNATNSITANYRKIFRFTCSFDLTRYPFDVQHCSMLLRSKMSIAYILLKGSETVSKKLKTVTVPPDYHFIGYTVVNCSIVGDKRNCYNYTYAFERAINQHIMLTYIPSLLIVIISFMSFWLELDAPGPRIGLGLTCLLTLATQFNNAQSQLPTVDRLKALDIWMFTCVVFVFSAIVEVAIANFLHRRVKSKASQLEKVDMPQKWMKTSPSWTPYGKLRRKHKPGSWRAFKMQLKKIFENNGNTKNFNPLRIDQVCRLVFPVVFLCFNIYYWTKYF